MYTKLLILFASASVVLSSDISVGSDTEGRKIFDEVRQANPAIWRQIENVTIIAPDDEVIGGVVVTDMRPEKDGDVQIVDGGEGKKRVTIELKSPTVLRGYEFHLEVYSVPETKLTDAEENLPSSDKTDTPKDSDKTLEETDGSGDDEQPSEIPDHADKTTEMPENVDKTTEMPESTTNNDIPPQVGRVDGDILRPSREANDESSPLMVPEENSNPNPSIIASESDATTTEIVKNEMDVTTEAETTTKLDENEQDINAAETFDNSKNIPDYPALSILDYIKDKEGTRRIRHTEDEMTESDHEASTTESIVQSTENEDTYTSPPADESSPSQNDDDTIDLLPPIETEYNTGFSTNDESTEKPIESPIDLNNRPRGGRGLDFDNLQEPSIPAIITAETTTLESESTESTTTEANLDEQARNTRDARKDAVDDSNGLDASLDPIKNEQTPSCGASDESDKQNAFKANVIILNGNEQLTLTPESYSKMQFGIPIVLILASDSNMPTIKIITESSNNEEKDVNIQPLESSVEENNPVPEDGLDEYPQVEKDEIPEDIFVPRPVMNFS